MKVSILLAAVSAVTIASAATPVIRPETVSFANVGATSDVAINFTLEGEAGIVTLDILTNGVSIGAANFRDGLYRNGVKADVFGKIIEPGEYKLVWKAGETWPGYRFRKHEGSVRVTAWSLDKPPTYMVVDILTNTNIAWYADAESIPGGVNTKLYKEDRFVMRRIPAGGVKWVEGASTTQADWPARYVTLSNDYYMGVFPVTQDQYWKVYVKCGATYGNASPSSHGSGVPLTAEDDPAALIAWRPVENMTYTNLRGDAPTHAWPQTGYEVNSERFMGLLRVRTGLMFDLPTAAQWEFAARAGADTKYHFGNTWDAKYGWASSTTTHPVGEKEPNAWGLYDLCGNVYERCLDWVHDFRPSNPTEDPVGGTGAVQKKIGANLYTLGREVRNNGANATSGSVAHYIVNDIAPTGASTYGGFRLWCPVSVRHLHK